MSFLEIGTMFCCVVIGVSLSTLGLGVEPGWTWLFALQILATATILPVVVLVITVAIFKIVPDRLYDVVIRAAVPTTLTLTAATALWSITMAVMGSTAG